MQAFIVNCGENNAGDLLMAAAVLDFLSGRGDVDRIRLNGAPLRRDDPHRSLVLRDDWRPPGTSAGGKLAARLGKLLRRRRTARGREQVEGIGPGDVVFDVNGYRHGDRWGVKALESDLALARHVRERGGRFVHMPKSYGPFSEGQRPLMEALCAELDRVYARDRPSFERVAPFCGPGRVKLSPDYSCAVAPAAPPAELAGLGPYALVIPNDKLVETGVLGGSADYARYLLALADRLEAASANPVFLFHQLRDALIYRRGLEEAGRRCLLFTDPRRAKGAIAGAEFVVSARYHGMVSALTQERPGLFFGWSDKYRGFLDLFGLGPEALVEKGRVAEGPALVEAAWRGRDDPALRVGLSEGAARIRGYQQALWGELSALIDG